MMFIGADVANCAERVFYSIHLASFKSLHRANIKVNALKKKSKIIFWKETDVPKKGKFYRIYLGRYNSRDKAFVVWKRLKKEGAVSYLGIHEFREPFDRGDTENHTKVVLKKETAVRKYYEYTERGKRFVEKHDGTIIDKETNLMWIKNGWRLDFISAVTWLDAEEKCKSFKHGGHTDWRLPTLKEWKSIISAENQCPALVEPNPFKNIIVHMPYWSGTDYIYDPKQSSVSGKAVRAYTVMLYRGNISHQNKNINAFILPVRSIK